MTEGTRIDFGDGRTYVVRPLNGRELIALIARIREAHRDPDRLAGVLCAIGGVIDALHASLRSSHPTLSRDDVAALVDAANIGHVLAAMTSGRLGAASNSNPVRHAARNLH